MTKRVSLVLSISKEEVTPAHVLKFHFRVERGDDEDLQEVAIIWRVPLLDPARWEAIIRTF